MYMSTEIDKKLIVLIGPKLGIFHNPDFLEYKKKTLFWTDISL